MLGSNLQILEAKYAAPNAIDYVKINDDGVVRTLIDEENASGDVVLENNKEVTISENGTVVVSPTEGKDAMKNVTATVAVPVPTLEANKAITIDASSYTNPVVIEPSVDKDAMEKATVTVSNIPEAVNVQATKSVTLDVSTETSATVTPDAGYDALAEATVVATNIPVIQETKSFSVDGLSSTGETITPATGFDAIGQVNLTVSRTFKGSTELPCFTGTGAVDGKTYHFIGFRSASGHPLAVSELNFKNSYFILNVEGRKIYRGDAYSQLDVLHTIDYVDSATFDIIDGVFTVTYGATTEQFTSLTAGTVSIENII